MKELAAWKKRRCCIIAYPAGLASVKPIDNTIEIIKALDSEPFLVTGCETHEYFQKNGGPITHSIPFEYETNLVRKISFFFKAQWKVSMVLLKERKRTDNVIFLMGGDLLTIPLLIAKIIGNKPVIMFSGSSMRFMKYYGKGASLLAPIAGLTTYLNCELARTVIVYSKGIARQFGLTHWSDKTIVANHHMIDFNSFKNEKRITSRPIDVAYVGRFSPEKGVMQFIRSLPNILQEFPGASILLMGDGRMEEQVSSAIRMMKNADNIRILPWKDHSEIPAVLNDIKLLLIPAFSEGLPNIMLEAMACGTPVLATSVGGIPDLIEDGVNGFLMEDNEPETIARRISEIFSHTVLENVSEKAAECVREEFNLDKKIVTWRKIIDA